jgi:L-ascorbate metabolism protein UlaG (beta-lactamase superfamily)
MLLTKFEHACVLVEDGDARILIDPGTYSHGFEDLTDLTGLLITHQHADHVDVDRLRPLVARNPNAAVHADEATAEILAEQRIATSTVRAGDHFDAGTEVSVYGVHHARIHEDIPLVPNVGYLVGGRFFHPGDAFTVPDVPVDVLALPTAAPWLKLSESIDYVRTVAPRVAVPIHEAIHAMPDMAYQHFRNLALDGTTITVIKPGSTAEV